MIFSEIKNEKEEVLYTDIPEDLNSSFPAKDSVTKEGYKQIYFSKKDVGSVRLISDIKNELFITNKIANRTAKTYLRFIPILSKIKENNALQYSIYSHNLVTTHSRLQDEIESIIPEQSLAKAKTYEEQLSLIKKSLEVDLENKASSIFSLAKRIIDLSSQITGFKVLAGEVNVDISPQDIKRFY